MAKMSKRKKDEQAVMSKGKKPEQAGEAEWVDEPRAKQRVVASLVGDRQLRIEFVLNGAVEYDGKEYIFTDKLVIVTADESNINMDGTLK